MHAAQYISDPLYPQNPYTAVNKNGTVYLLKGNMAYKFDTSRLKIIDYPDNVHEIFPGIPNWIEVNRFFTYAAFMGKNS